MDEVLATARAVLDALPSGASRVVDALFRDEVEVPADEVRAHVGTAALDALLAVGLVRETASRVVSAARLTRFGGRLIASDRMGFRNHPDFVLAPGPATASLAAAVRPLERGRALDLGCGPGSLALWLAGPGADVLGLDISARALAFASFNRRFNALPRATFRVGDFLTAPPDEGLDEQFDVCVANPPFVLSPRTELVYRDAPLPRDDTTRVALERAARTLAPGGRAYVIGSWADDGRGPWEARPRAWLRGLEGRAIITRISSVAPSTYARSWTRDLDQAARLPAIATWAAWLGDSGIERITTGLVVLARPRHRTWRAHAGVAALDGGRSTWPLIERALAG